MSVTTGFSVPLDLIDEAGDNPRREVGDVSELAASIDQLGLQQPLVLTPADGGRYLLVAGHRRLAACRLLGRIDAPAVLSEVTGDRDRFAAMIVENIHREDLTRDELAAAYGRLRDDYGLNHRQIAELVGKSQSHVGSLLQRLKDPDARQAELEDIRARRLAGDRVTGRPLADASPESVVRKLRDADPRSGAVLTHEQAQTALRLIERALRLIRDLESAAAA